MTWMVSVVTNTATVSAPADTKRSRLAASAPMSAASISGAAAAVEGRRTVDGGAGGVHHSRSRQRPDTRYGAASARPPDGPAWRVRSPRTNHLEEFMAEEVAFGDAGAGKLRSFGVGLFLTVITLGIYYWFWYYLVNDELKDIGVARGDQKLAGSSPALRWRR